MTISVKTLHDVYEAFNIKQKKVATKAPVTPAHLMEKRAKEKRVLKFGLEHVHHHKIPLYYCDEATFTVKDYRKLCWSNPKENIVVDFHQTPPAVSVSIIMSETGIITRNMRVGAFVKEDHWAFLHQFRSDLGHEREVALYTDGLSFHHSKATKDILKE